MIFVFGNGLSIGFDPRLTTTAITARVVDSLGSEDEALEGEHHPPRAAAHAGPSVWGDGPGP